MLTKTMKIRCDDCGKFIPIEDVMSGAARHVFALPDSDFSDETYDSQCAACRAKAPAPVSSA